MLAEARRSAQLRHTPTLSPTHVLDDGGDDGLARSQLVTGDLEGEPVTAHGGGEVFPLRLLLGQRGGPHRPGVLAVLADPPEVETAAFGAATEPGAGLDEEGA